MARRRKKKLAAKYIVRRIIFALILLALLAGLIWLLMTMAQFVIGLFGGQQGSSSSSVASKSSSSSTSSVLMPWEMDESSSSEESSVEESASSEESTAGEESSTVEESSSEESAQPEESTPAQEEPPAEESSPAEGSGSQHADYSADWNLLLVNRDYPLDETFSVELDTPYPPYRFDKRASSFLVEMIEAARADGIQLQIISTYRDLETQHRLFNNKVAEYLNLGYDREEARVQASQWVAIPGTSEHGTGLAVDVVSAVKSYELNESFAQSEEFRWLYANCAKYGFILRFPKGKEHITHITYEPWHYRYVGKEIAYEIMSRGICLEEYIAEQKALQQVHENLASEE